MLHNWHRSGGSIENSEELGHRSGSALSNVFVSVLCSLVVYHVRWLTADFDKLILWAGCLLLAYLRRLWEAFDVFCLSSLHAGSELSLWKA